MAGSRDPRRMADRQLGPLARLVRERLVDRVVIEARAERIDEVYPADQACSNASCFILRLASSATVENRTPG